MSLKRVSSTDRDVSPPSAKRRIAATTSSKAVSNFFKPASQREPEKVTFQVIAGTLLVGRYQNANTVKRPKPLKIAAFDFDNTLITTKSGNKYSRGPDDWKWWNDVVPGRLKQLNADGYAVVVISNQGAVSLRSDTKTPKAGMLSLHNFKGKVKAVLNSLELPITLYAATGPDLYRKPRTGVWEEMLKGYQLSDVGDIDHEKCVFVGDAAGREADKRAGVKKDHACSDRDFATNIGIPFLTPEEYFLGETAKPFIRTFDPARYVDSELLSQTDEPPIVFTQKHDVELVLFCGSPGSGKSTFFWRRMQPLGYERVNQDILKTRAKCKKLTTELIGSGKPVVVDNTNADIETRADWVKLAKELNVPIRLISFTASAKLCEHNDAVRALTGHVLNPEKRTMLPTLAFTSFAARYREPKVDEGFEDITIIDFQFEGTEEQKALWTKFWVS